MEIDLNEKHETLEKANLHDLEFRQSPQAWHQKHNPKKKERRKRKTI